MRFRLLQHKSTKALVTFHVQNSKGETVGSIDVPPSEASDLQKHWAGAYGPPAAKPSVPTVKLPRLSKAALLRS